jgi:preprotein translocase subunit SecB
MTPKNDPHYKILRIYLKGVSVEVPHMAQLLASTISPHIGVNMDTEAHAAWPGALECVLRISLHARTEGMNVFMIEVSVAGVFELPPLEPDEITRFVRKVAPSVLFPFARKDLAALAVSAGFQPVLLDHVDFDALLTQVINQHRAPSAATANAMALAASRPAVLAAQLSVASSPAAEKHAAAATPVADQHMREEEAAQEWPSTEPKAVLLAAPVPRLRLAAMAASALILLAGVAAWRLWPAAPQTATLPVLVQAQLAPAPAETPAATQRVLDQSRQRLAELPLGWHSVALGTMERTADIGALDELPLQRPLYLQMLPDQRLQVLYGAFPTLEAADEARVQASQWSAAGLSGEAKVVSLE